MSGILSLFKQEIGTLVFKDIQNLDYSKVTVDEQTIEQTKEFATRHRCSQRLGKGLFFTDAVKAKTIKELRSIVLP